MCGIIFLLLLIGIVFLGAFAGVCMGAESLLGDARYTSCSVCLAFWHNLSVGGVLGETKRAQIKNPSLKGRNISHCAFLIKRYFDFGSGILSPCEQIVERAAGDPGVLLDDLNVAL